MNNFNFHVSTEILFGKGRINELPKVLKKYGKNVLLVYGGKSIKVNKIYNKINELLTSFNIYELSGVEPNPRIESVRDGVKICKENKIDVILAVGGGSVIDCAKVTACGAFYNGDAWDIVKQTFKPEKAIPIVTVLTLAATGSEMNSSAVITNFETNEKLGVTIPITLPKTSILDPTYLFTLPAIQTAAGTADIMSHIFEVYFNNSKTAFVTDRFCESLLKTCIKYLPIALKEPDNYEARSNLMWAGSLAINGLCACGKFDESWSCHPIEHQLSAYYDITHGTGLAILTPHWMRYILSEKTVDKFDEYAKNVWNLPENKDKMFLANQAIDLTEQFFKKCGIPMTLSELGIDDSKFEIMAQKAVKARNLQNAYIPLKEDDIIQIFKNSL
ncbi:MAG: iron-containing alcohol dehydrogenase [Oscillospiraceae bacterium]|nr:iron-containing alcohol dehydrogenase [Oscillospiraceae bacterium]